MQNQITTILPADVPTPKFQMFQQVRLEFKSGGRKNLRYVTGSIVGMDYLTPQSALVQRCYTGWVYTVDLIYGLQEQEMFELVTDAIDVREQVYEGDLLKMNDGYNVTQLPEAA